MGGERKGRGGRWKRERKKKGPRVSIYRARTPWQFLIAKARYWWLDALYRVLCIGRVYFSPLPLPSTAVCNYRCCISTGPLYFLRTGTYIHIRTYLFFVDTRRHCCELNATLCEIPRLQLPLPRHDIYTDLDPLSVHLDVSIFRNFSFFFSPPFFPLKFSFLFARVKTVDLLDRLGLAVNKRICFIGVESATSSRYDLQF